MKPRATGAYRIENPKVNKARKLGKVKALIPALIIMDPTAAAFGMKNRQSNEHHALTLRIG